MPILIGDWMAGFSPASRTFYLTTQDRAKVILSELGTTKSVFETSVWDGDENPDDLIAKKGYEVYDEMLRCDTVDSGSRLIALSVVGPGWTVQPAESDDPQAVEVSDFVKWNFEALEGPFKDAELGILTGRDYGWSISELNWGIVKEGDHRGRFALRSIKNKKPHDWKFQLDRFDNIEMLVHTEQGSGELDRFAWKDPKMRRKWVHYAHDARKAFGSPYGRSQHRNAYRYYKADLLIFPKWGIFVDRVAGGNPVLSYPPGTKPAQREEYEEMVRDLESSSSVAKPDNVLLEYMAYAGTSHLQFQKFLEYCQRSVLRVILLPAELGIGPEASVGSMAKAEVHQKVFDWVTGDMDRDLTTAVQEQIANPLVDVNFDVGGKYPKWSHKNRDPEDGVKLVAAFVAAVEKGVVGEVTREDENRTRDLLGWPEISEKEWKERKKAEEEEKAKAPPPPPPPAPENPDEPPVDDKGGKTQVAVPDGAPGTGAKVESDSPPLTEGAKDASQDEYGPLAGVQEADLARITRARVERGLIPGTKYLRDLTEVEKRAKLRPKKIEEKLTGIEAVGEARIITAMARVQRRLVKQLDRAGLLDGTGSKVALWSYGGLDGTGKREFREAVLTMLYSGYVNGALDCRREIEAATKGKAEFEGDDAGPERLEFAEITGNLVEPEEAKNYFGRLTPMNRAAAQAYRREAFWITGVYLEDHGTLLTEVKNYIHKGFTSGNWRAVEGRINDVFRQWVGAGGLEPVVTAAGQELFTPWHTRIIVRNAVMRSYNAGRFEMMRQAREWVEAYQWSSIIDSRTTDHCDSMDGQVFKLGQVEFPPAHHQCRSMVVAVTKGFPFKYADQDTLLEAAKLRDVDFTSGVIG